MKRNAPEHWKMDAFATKLGVCLAQAVGHIEMLFHLTAKQSPHGNIGKMPDAHIAKKCGWDGDPSLFIAALVECRWVDVCSQQRLIVHDWHEHCDDATKKSVSRSETPFLRPISTVPENGGQCPTESDKICLPSLALPSPAKPDQRADNVTFQGLPSSLDEPGFREAWSLWEEYQKQSGKGVIQPITRVQNFADLARMGPEKAQQAVRLALGKGWKTLVLDAEELQRPPPKQGFKLPSSFEVLKQQEAMRRGPPITQEQKAKIIAATKKKMAESAAP